ncbi:MAG: glucokinase, partial [Pseudomonadota bacterium]
MLLAGDVGGTKTVLGLYENGAEGLECVGEGVFPSGSYDSLESVLGVFLRSERPGTIDAACFGVAGPVVDGLCEATNLPWSIEAAKLAGSIGCRDVSLLNDLE